MPIIIFAATHRRLPMLDVEPEFHPLIKIRSAR
jgi:hypothetical protein